MTEFAYAEPIDETVPNLRTLASSPWMGLTAYISEKPHLVIGRLSDEEYILEDEAGQQFVVDFVFPWETPNVESNRLVAASRTLESPFRGTGLLHYNTESGEWLVVTYKDASWETVEFPLEDHVAALEANNWKFSDESAGGFDKNNDVVVPVHGKCPHCGSDSVTYAEDADLDNLGETKDESDPVVLCHACHQWCHQSEVDTTPDDASDNQHTDEKDLHDPDKPKGPEATPENLSDDETHHFTGYYASLNRFAASETIPCPTHAIHNQTSALFAQHGITATVQLPNGPSIQLPFSSPMNFMQVMKWRMQDYPAATGSKDTTGSPLLVESENLPLAIQLIQQAGESDPNAHAGAYRYADLGVSTDDDAANQVTDRPEKAIVCPNCGSHSIETIWEDEEKGSAEWLCLTCGKQFKADYRKQSGAEHPKGTRIEIIHPSKKGTKGSISDHVGTDDAFGDNLYNILCDNGEELEKVPEVHFKKIKSSSFHLWADSDSDESGSSGSNDPTGHDDDIYESCPKCHKQTKKSKEVCEHCGHKKDEKESSFLKGAPYPENSYKNAPDHSPEGQKEWPEEVNAIYNACMREGKGDKSKCAAIAWSTYNKNDGHPEHSDKNACFMCGNQKTAALCEHCGYIEDDNLWKESAGPGWTFQGAVLTPGTFDGIAIKPEEQGKDGILQTLQQLPTNEQAEKTYVQQQNDQQGTSFPMYDNPFTNRGGSTKEAAPGGYPLHPEAFRGGFILAQKWVTPEDTLLFVNPQTGETDPRFRGFITSTGGNTSHAMVVARAQQLVCIFTTHENIDKIQPGDHIKIDGNGIVAINGGDASFTGQDPSQVKAHSTLFRFVWSKGHGLTARVNPENINEHGTMHPDLITKLFEEGQWDFEDWTAGYFYDDGVVDENNDPRISDQPAFESWIHSVGQQAGVPVTNIVEENIAAKVMAKTASELTEGNWYTMISPKVSVPDVVHIQKINEEGITAAIEGDDKGLFPIKIDNSQIAGYSFTPYTPKTAKSSLSAQEQSDLINENMSGRARNLHKLDLKGTHYPSKIEAMTTNPLDEEIHWL